MSKQTKPTSEQELRGEKLKHDFWARVIEVSPGDIRSKTIMVVADKDIDWLLSHYRQQVIDEVKKEKYTGDYCGESYRDGWNRALDRAILALKGK